MARLTINHTPHHVFLCMIGRYIIRKLKEYDLKFSVTSPDMDGIDIDACIHDPSEREYYLVNRRVPVQIVVQGVESLIHLIECDANSFCTEQLLRRTSTCLESGHSVMYDLYPIDHNVDHWPPLTRSQPPAPSGLHPPRPPKYLLL